MGVLYDFLFSLSALREKHPALLRELRLSFTQDSSEDMPYCEEFSSERCPRTRVYERGARVYVRPVGRLPHLSDACVQPCVRGRPERARIASGCAAGGALGDRRRGRPPRTTAPFLHVCAQHMILRRDKATYWVPPAYARLRCWELPERPRPDPQTGAYCGHPRLPRRAGIPP